MRIRSNILIAIFTISILSARAQGNLPLACAGSLVRYGVDGLASSTFEWTVTGGEIVANYNDSVDVLWGYDNGNFSIQVVENAGVGCIADPYIAYITIDTVNVEIGDYAKLCEGDTINIVLNGNYANVEWSDGNVHGNVFPATKPGIVWVNVININNCHASDSVLVDVNQLPDVDLGDDIRLCDEQTIRLFAGDDGITYNWSNGTNGVKEIVVHATEVAQAYFVNVTDANDCKNSDTIVILACIPYEQIKKTIPTAISPNGDYRNDYFEIPGIEQYPNAEVEIYDRWGRMVFRSNIGYTEPWDGTFKGAELPTDSYFYVIDLKEGRNPLTGSISIFRGEGTPQ